MLGKLEFSLSIAGPAKARIRLEFYENFTFGFQLNANHENNCSFNDGATARATCPLEGMATPGYLPLRTRNILSVPE
jgi:hypothetical protein